MPLLLTAFHMVFFHLMGAEVWGELQPQLSGLQKCTEIDALWSTLVAPTKFISFSNDDSDDDDDDGDDGKDNRGFNILCRGEYSHISRLESSVGAERSQILHCNNVGMFLSLFSIARCSNRTKPSK